MQISQEFWWSFAIGSLTLLTLAVAYVWNIVANQRRSIASHEKQLHEREEREAKLMLSQQQLRNLSARMESIREEERLKISREVHDELGQILTVIKIHLKDVAEEVKSGERPVVAQLLERLDSLTKMVDGSITMVKKISAELRPLILDNLGLKEAIEWEARRIQDHGGLECSVDFPPGELHFGKEAQIGIFRIYQETLTNVLRHSSATKMQTRMRCDPNGFTMEMHDNGKGIADEAINDPGALGIVGMRERALLLHGELTISSQNGGGTLVSLFIPASAAQWTPRPARRAPGDNDD